MLNNSMNLLTSAVYRRPAYTVRNPQNAVRTCCNKSGWKFDKLADWFLVLFQMDKPHGVQRLTLHRVSKECSSGKIRNMFIITASSRKARRFLLPRCTYSITDKILMAGSIMVDVIVDTVKANAGEIREILENAPEDGTAE